MGGNGKYIDTEKQKDVFVKSVRAGKRTYFFDVKATKNNDFYLTVTESKKQYDESGQYIYEKHKIFIYPEDFMKFQQALSEAIEFISQNTMPEEEEFSNTEQKQEVEKRSFSEISFDDFEV